MNKSHSKKIIAIIPARGGSKGIPKKNIYPLNGKPLISYSIEAALSSKLIDQVFVSTDDDQIANTALEYGAEVPFLRPKGISGDKAVIGKAVWHMLNQLYSGKSKPFAFATLFPTHPFRRPGLIDCLLGKLIDSYDRVITARPFIVTPSTFFVPGLNDISPLVQEESIGGPYPLKCHRPYGLFEAKIFNPRNFPSYFYEINDPVELVDIDTHEDLRYAELILQHGLFN